MTSVETLLCELIALPSVNPAFLPADHPNGGEQRALDFLASRAAAAGLDVEFQKVTDNRANLLARISPPEQPRRGGATAPYLNWPKQRVILAPHLDTVDASERQFRPRVAGTKIFGRGACDTKGSAAAMLQAMIEVARSGRRPQETEILFAGLVDEENAQLGSRALGQSELKADLAIVGEPTRLRVVTAHKGSLWLRLRTEGLSAHGSRPELGRNAVHEMARVVDWLQTRYAAVLARRKHPLLGSPTVSVGTICGGTQANIVPDSCEIVVDRRTLPGETQTGLRRELRTLLKKAGLKAEVSSAKSEPCLPLETNARLPAVSAFLKSVRQKRPEGAHYFCDAAVLAHAGIPSVVFGPGDIAQAHTASEWISRESLGRATSILERFLRELP